MSTIRSKKVQLGTDANAANNFTLYQPATPDGTLRIGVGNADSPTEVGRFTSAGYKPATAPAFSAYPSSAQSFTAGVYTKTLYGTEEWDSKGDYDASNSRFQPTVAGYYQISAAWCAATIGTNIAVAVYKNGSQHKRMSNIQANAAIIAGSLTVYCNGTTDYIEIYTFVSNTQNNFPSLMHFQGILVQQA